MNLLEPPPVLQMPRLPLPDLKPIRCGAEVCQDLLAASSREWVITNGLGGYASSTILGMNTRRYHGLLVAATHPPVGRLVILSKVEETLVVPGGRYDLATNQYQGLIHPEGYRYLVEFRLDPWPTFLYQIGGEILLKKSVFLLPGENAVVVGYSLHSAPRPVELVLRPLMAVRDFRWTSRENSDLNNRIEQAPGVITLRPYEGLPPVVIHHTAELVEPSPCWYKNFEYAAEGKSQEDLWSPGQLLYLLKSGESCAFVVSTGRRGTVELAFHERRLENTQTVTAQMMTPPGKGPLTRRLSWTGESFVARRLAGDTFLMAGFPWLSSWGRDALIALPGLTLTLQRFDLAREILQTLASQLKGGLIPVRLGEEDGSPEYDSADTSLWFIWAVWHYWKATRQTQFVAKKLLGPMREIIEAYLEGTHFGIGMDEDGLILLSDQELPLTWMDAREPTEKGQIPGQAVTPRPGKPVEINALWYCALVVMGQLGERLGLKRAPTYLRLSRLVKGHFSSAFTNLQGTLADRVIPARSSPAGGGTAEAGWDSAIRPNVLIAASLPFSPVSKPQAELLLDVAEKHLLTPVGLRTLSPTHPQYQGQCAGDLKSRAKAYHQGTVWPWLIGPYVSAVIRTRGLTRATQGAIRKQLEPFLAHLEEGALGSVSEIFDGDPPYTPRGTPSQVWSVGEILRAIREAHLEDL
ncbi:MAG: glycogen debranching enzyme N-terminal domain-containing protein [Candidatus Omnitrophica bacterium]|nr:glycogen debranching enzyme N-terminal domain-containing protein [Candidatus Omnitrophota bacterium]